MTEDTSAMKSETNYNLATVVQGEEVGYASGGAGTVGVKQGHKYCGGCCDMRRAVIIVNIINICVTVIAAMGVLAVGAASSSAAAYDDDEVQAALGEMGNLPVGTMIAFLVVKMLASGLGIYGGVSYNVICTGISAAAYVVEVVMSLIALNVFGVVYAAFFAYPHFFFIQEVRKGIMSPVNYANEKQSCCCV